LLSSSQKFVRKKRSPVPDEAYNLSASEVKMQHKDGVERNLALRMRAAPLS
jgi:hypothetical protein